MGFWDVKYKDLCEQNDIKIDLDMRYVDDKNQGLGSIPQGYRWTGEKLDFKEEWRLEDQEIGLENDKRTCQLLVSMANTIDPMIQMEGDWPSNHESGRVPMLDLQMRVVMVEEKDDNGNEVIYPQLVFTFYKKEMAAKQIMHATSAMPDKIKWENASNEMIRRINNTMRGVKDTDEEKIKVINEYMGTLKISGYKESFREKLHYLQ